MGTLGTAHFVLYTTFWFLRNIPVAKTSHAEQPKAKMQNYRQKFPGHTGPHRHGALAQFHSAALKKTGLEFSKNRVLLDV